MLGIPVTEDGGKTPICLAFVDYSVYTTDDRA